MNRQALTLHHQTRLAVNILIEDDTGMLAYSILFVTSLFAYIWHISRIVATTRQELCLLVTDLKAAFHFTAKVLTIGFNSLAYGLGIII